MNKIIGIIVVILVIVGGIYLFTQTSNISSTNSDTSTPNNTEGVTTQGRVVFSVTDAALDMNTISEISMKVNSVDVHSTTSGWTTVSTTSRVYNLLALNANNESQLLADINTEVGTYDQIRLMIDSISIKTKAGVFKEAKLPSGEIKINTNLVVNANTTSSVNFDFLADKSLHITGSGAYIFAPVVKTETKSNATVNVDIKNVVTVNNGHLDDTNTVGMDIDGNVKLNFQINSKQQLDLDSNNTIKIKGSLLQ